MDNILKKAKDFLSWIKKPSLSKQGIHPVKDWNTILLFAGVSLLICGCFAFFFYKEVKSGKIFSINKNDSQKEVRINTYFLKDAIDDINLREKNLADVKAGKISQPDPGL